MTIYIFRSGKGFTATNNAALNATFGDEGAAVDAAVRFTQDAGASAYILNYYRP